MDDQVNTFDADFASFESFSGEVNEQSFGKTSNDDWSADFQAFEECTNIEEKQDGLTDNKNKNSLETFSELCKKCFKLQFDNESRVTETVQDSYKSSFLSSSLQSQILEPIKPKGTNSYKMLLQQIKGVLDPNKVKAAWLVDVSEAPVGTFRNNFDYHVLCENKESPAIVPNKNKKTSKSGSIEVTAGINQQNGLQKQLHNDHLKKTLSGINPGNGVISSDDLSTEKIASFSLPDLEFSVKNSLEDLSAKPIEELQSLATELELQAKIYSELLLSELDNRDDLQRQQEIMNNFISSHVAVERKLSQNKHKQKSRYGFFKYPEENKNAELTIPYFCHDGSGPTISELSLITEILKAMEREDPEAPRMISDYVFKLGNRFDLDTVIKVRTSTGVTPIESHVNN